MTVRPPARLIIPLWGESYLRNFLDIVLPAHLAPGNLPAIAERFDCELLLLTEERYFARIRQSEPFLAANRVCRSRLVPIDDLVAHRGMYGLSLTYAMHRGFADLGEAMVDFTLFFFLADFVVADGGGRTIADKLLSGQRLVLAPSYCAVEEEIAPRLRAMADREGGRLSLAPRALAALALAHRHDTVRAKTVNQQDMHIDVADQFYWRVGEEVLLGRQLPPSIVAMKPERPYAEPVCFWDYGTISMACPQTQPCILGDSDQLMMAELRPRRTLIEQLREGPAKKDEIATRLGSFATADQCRLGRHSLSLHAGDLPEGTEQERAKLNSYVDDIYALFPAEPVAFVDHPYWTARVERFSKARNDWSGGRTVAAVKVVGDGSRPMLSPSRYLYRLVFGVVPRVTPLHPLWADSHHIVGVLDDALAAGARKTLAVASRDSYVAAMLDDEPGEHWSVPVHLLAEDQLPPEASSFDLCLMELGWAELMDAKQYLRHVLPRMCPGATVVLYHAGEAMQRMALGVAENLPDLVDFGGSRRVLWSGGALVASSASRYRHGLENHPRGGWRRLFSHVMLMLRCAPAAAFASRDERSQDGQLQPLPPTSVTIEIRLASEVDGNEDISR